MLRHGIELLGLKQSLKLAKFKLALAINADILARHGANRLPVVRQVRYSLHNENSIDLGKSVESCWAIRLPSMCGRCKIEGSQWGVHRLAGTLQ